MNYSLGIPTWFRSCLASSVQLELFLSPLVALIVLTYYSYFNYFWEHKIEKRRIDLLLPQYPIVFPLPGPEPTCLMCNGH